MTFRFNNNNNNNNNNSRVTSATCRQQKASIDLLLSGTSTVHEIVMIVHDMLANLRDCFHNNFRFDSFLLPFALRRTANKTFTAGINSE